MSVARGILNYLDKADAIQAVEKKKQDEREALVLELGMKYGVGSSPKGKSSEKYLTRSASLAEKLLIRDYGVSSEVLAPLIATDQNAGKKLLTILEKQEKQYKGTGRELPKERINEILESAIAQQPEDSKIDFERYENFIGRPLDSLYKQMLKEAASSSGEVYFSDPAVMEQPTVTELQPKLAAQWQQAGGKREKSIIIERIAELRRLPQEEQTDSIKNEISLLSDRSRKLTTALDNFESNPGLLIDLYGNSYLNHLLGKYPKYDGYIPESFVDSRFSYPTVASEQMAMVLLQADIVEEGTVFRLPNGELIQVMKQTQ
jgi:hypothetical protein